MYLNKAIWRINVHDIIYLKIYLHLSFMIYFLFDVNNIFYYLLTYIIFFVFLLNTHIKFLIHNYFFNIRK